MGIKAKLQAGQKVFGTMLRISRSPAIYLLARQAGLDFVMFDCEHGDYTTRDLHDLNLAGAAMGVDSLARVPALARDNISRTLDCAAAGVMCPMTETPGQAADLVGYSKFAPVGRRGFAAGHAGTAYAGGKAVELMENANNRILTIAQIETRLAVDNAGLIAATEGIDVLLVGPNDLSVSLGVPGDLTNPIELEAISHVAAQCKSRGKWFGMHAGTGLLERFKEQLDMVMSMTDTDLLLQSMQKMSRDCKELLGASRV